MIGNYSGVKRTDNLFIELPKVTYIVHMAKNFEVHCTDKKPSKFQCWMMKLCFGWRVEIP